MKRFLYSNYTKFIAFILCALFIAVSSYLLTSNFVKEDNIYCFESSYENSHAAGNALNSEFIELSQMLENTTDENGNLHIEKLKDMPPNTQWEYYIKVNDKEYSNVKDQKYADFENSDFSMGVSADLSVKHGSAGNIKNREGFANNRAGYGGYYFIDGQKDSYQLCVRMSEQYKEEQRAAWENMKTTADSTVKQVLALLFAAGIMFVYLLCVTGRKYGSDEISMLLVDKMFVEITAILLLGIFFGLGMLTIFGAAYFIVEEGIMIANQAASMMIFAVVSLSMLLLLSLVRNMKNGSFAKRSLIVKICVFLYNTAKKILIFLGKLLKKIFYGIKKALSEIKRSILMVSAKNFGGRFAGIMIIGFVIVVCILCLMMLANPAFIVALAAFVIWAVVTVSKRLAGFEMVKEGIEKIKNGDLNHKITDCPTGVIGEMADNINTIGDGLQKSLENEIKAERMKSELITNVSHDLKTPLTSIINYADLLSKEKLTPDEANDYVAIIKQKGERLKQLTNDLFDISKVQSGNEQFDLEDIDLCLLVNQTLAELNEQIMNSGLVFKVKSDDKEIFVKADGRKMSRVFENLVINCVKYAMKNTRVYIDIKNGADRVFVEIKNIAGYEMDFDESEIAERFVRGDSSRSSEGSGLGLAIVKSYVEGCGGRLDIKKDGDLFKVIIYFNK